MFFLEKSTNKTFLQQYFKIIKEDNELSLTMEDVYFKGNPYDEILREILYWFDLSG